MWSDGFEIETLIHIRVVRAGLVVTEVPSFEHQRIQGISNLNAFGDGIHVLGAIFTRASPGQSKARFCRCRGRILLYNAVLPLSHLTETPVVSAV